jgi:ubiquinone/menaquinone biosynthesis C-methylase UbiE
MSASASSEGSSYVFDAESAIELARLLEHNILISHSMGGLFPEGTDLSQTKTILDIACGPGGWVMEVARENPSIHVTGFDISDRMIQYARASASVRGLDNVTFRVMDATKPLDFPDGSFDIVNARTIVAFMQPAQWPSLLQEMYRVCRPGGIVRLIEGEMPVTSSPAFEKITSLFLEAMHKQGRLFSPDGRHFCITAVMGSLMREAGFQDVCQLPTMGEFSSGTEAHEITYQDFMVIYHEIEPLLVNMELISSKDYQLLYQQALAEMLADDFCAIGFVLLVWGKRPEGGAA